MLTREPASAYRLASVARIDGRSGGVAHNAGEGLVRLTSSFPDPRENVTENDSYPIKYSGASQSRLRSPIIARCRVSPSGGGPPSLCKAGGPRC